MKIATIIDIWTTPAPTYDEARAAEVGLSNLRYMLQEAGGYGTFAITKSAALARRVRNLLATYAAMTRDEFAASGAYSDQDMSYMTAPEQNIIINSTLASIKRCVICGMVPKQVTGFIPPVLGGETEATLEAATMSGLSYVLSDNSTPMAKPISKTASGAPLYDKLFADDVLGWQDALNDALAAGQDMVWMVSTDLSSPKQNLEFWNVYCKFLTTAKAAGCQFVSLSDL